MIEVPQALEDAAWRAAAAELGDAALADAALGRAIVDRSARYTTDRAHLATAADPRGDLAARATFFTVADAMKVSVPLRELANRDALPARRPLRVIDVGAGCGAMTLGALAALPDRDLDVTAIDRDAAALRIAARAVAEYGGPRVRFAARAGELRALGGVGPAELIVLGSVLNELADPAARDAAIAAALAAITDDGAVVVVEPASRDCARALHAARDAAIARGAHVFAPCTRTAAPCAALADARDWCHEDRAVALPARTRELARRTHLRDGGLRFAYVVLRRQPLGLVDLHSATLRVAARPGGAGAIESSHAWRVVSAPRPDKGKLELYGCSDAGRVPLRRLRRHRAPDNAAIERADRGDVLVVDASVADGRVEVTAETVVTRLTPAK
jgi:ribosomal protein RSM22 (predicted rRNA methylase)